MTAEDHFAAAECWAEKEGHLPSEEARLVDLDLRFAAAETVRYRDRLRVKRQLDRDAMLTLIWRMSPLTKLLKKYQPDTVGIVAKEIRTGGWAALTILLAWPDVEFVMGFIKGFKVVGALWRSMVYPPNPKFDAGINEKDLLIGAEEFTDYAEQRVRKANQRGALVESCELDEKKHFGEVLRTRAEMDEEYGKGN